MDGTNSSLDAAILLSVNEKIPNKNTWYKITHQTKRNMSEESVKTYQTNLNCDVSQQIQVEEQDFKCIINLNTTVCASKSKHRRTCNRKHRLRYTEHKKKSKHRNDESFVEEKQGQKDSRKKEKHSRKRDPINNEEPKYECPTQSPSAKGRITPPQCFRGACWYPNEHRKENLRRKNVLEMNHYEEWNRRYLNKDEVKHDHRPSKHHHHHHRIKSDHSTQEIYKQTRSRILLSPISSSPLEDTVNNLTYEDISNTSLRTQVEKKSPPPAYRLHHKPTKHNHVRRYKNRNEMQESKLDTLIRRTKERERKLVELSRRERELWITSTPIRNEYSSADFPMSSSDMDISFNSLSTFLLENNAYSPSCPIEDLQISTEDLQNLMENLQNSETGCRGYSPSSRIRNFTPKQPETDFKLLNVKNEPTVDIEAYSPTSKPKINWPDIEVKREILFKSEPLFSCAISPIYIENETDNTGLKFCKIENVKREIINDYVG